MPKRVAYYSNQNLFGAVAYIKWPRHRFITINKTGYTSMFFVNFAFFAFQIISRCDIPLETVAPSGSAVPKILHVRRVAEKTLIGSMQS